MVATCDPNMPLVGFRQARWPKGRNKKMDYIGI
jgi:hypothetical protein